MDIESCWYKNTCDHTCSNGCVRYNAMKSLCSKSGIPENLWIPKKLVCSTEDRRAFSKLNNIKDNITEFVNDGASLVIHSDICGNGKTSWALKMILNYFNQNWHEFGLNCAAAYVNVSCMLFEYKQAINVPSEEFNRLNRRIQDCNLVLFDDIAVSALTPYEHQILINIIDKRVMSGKSNIYTTNCTGANAKERLGDRLYSRVFDASVQVEIRGAGKRGVIND